MVYKPRELTEVVSNLRALGEMLVPHNYPLSPILASDDLVVFKLAETVVDGYPVVVHYQKSDYNDHYMVTVQVYGRNCPFLPFGVICKIGTEFLGDSHLYLVEMYKDNRKIYCWARCEKKDGEVIPPPYEKLNAETCEYEGLSYLYMQPNQINFY